MVYENQHDRNKRRQKKKVIILMTDYPKTRIEHSLDKNKNHRIIIVNL